MIASTSIPIIMGSFGGGRYSYSPMRTDPDCFSTRPDCGSAFWTPQRRKRSEKGKRERDQNLLSGKQDAVESAGRRKYARWNGTDAGGHEVSAGCGAQCVHHAAPGGQSLCGLDQRPPRRTGALQRRKPGAGDLFLCRRQAAGRHDFLCVRIMETGKESGAAGISGGSGGKSIV